MTQWWKKSYPFSKITTADIWYLSFHTFPSANIWHKYKYVNFYENRIHLYLLFGRLFFLALQCIVNMFSCHSVSFVVEPKIEFCPGNVAWIVSLVPITELVSCSHVFLIIRKATSYILACISLATCECIFFRISSWYCWVKGSLPVRGFCQTVCWSHTSPIAVPMNNETCLLNWVRGFPGWPNAAMAEV